MGSLYTTIPDKKIKGFNEGYITLNMEDFIRDNDTGKVINIIKK